MEEPEVPTEEVQKHVEEHAHKTGDGFTSLVAMSIAILAAFAALAALLAGDRGNEAMVKQIEQADQWSFYQSKGLKSAVLSIEGEILQSQGKSLPPDNQQKIDRYASEQEEIKKTAEEEQHKGRYLLRQHRIFAGAVTLFQVAIAIGAISALSKRQPIWYVSLFFGLGGLVLLIRGFLITG